MPYRPILTTHFENLSKHMSTLHGQIFEFLVLNLAVHVLIWRLGSVDGYL